VAIWFGGATVAGVSSLSAVLLLFAAFPASWAFRLADREDLLAIPISIRIDAKRGVQRIEAKRGV
jgi:hypothetical protein